MQETIEKTDSSGKILPEMVSLWHRMSLRSDKTKSTCMPEPTLTCSNLLAADIDLPELAEQSAAPKRVHTWCHTPIPM